MVAPLALLPIAISGIRALLKFRDRLDTILVTSEASEKLPYRLPPIPNIDRTPPQVLKDFFSANREKPTGIAIQDHETESIIALVVENNALGKIVEKIDSSSNLTEPEFTELARGYEVAQRLIQVKQGLTPPHPESASERGRDQNWLHGGDKLAYYLVDSARVSKNPAFVRILLATADTLMEFVGQNASLLVSDAKTANVIETLLREFALDGDLDEMESDLLFRHLLGAVAVTLENHRHLTKDSRVGSALVGALADLRKTPPQNASSPADRQSGDEFVATLLTADGFARLMGATATRLGQDRHFAQTEDVLRKTIGAVLREIGEVLPDGEFSTSDGHRIFEAAIAVIAEDFENRSRPRADPNAGLNGKTIAGFVLSILSEEIKNAAAGGSLVDGFSRGTLFPDLYRAVLQGIAANPALVADTGKSREYIEAMVKSVATTLAQTPLNKTLDREMVERIVADSLLITAKHTTLLTRGDDYAAKILEAALITAAPLVKDGITMAELRDIVDTAVRAAADNLSLADMSGNLRPVADAFAAALTNVGASTLRDSGGRIAFARVFLRSLSQNSKAWKYLSDRTETGQIDIIKPLIDGITMGIVDGQGGVFQGPHMVEALDRSLAAALIYSDRLADAKIDEPLLRAVIKSLLTSIEEQSNKGIRRELLPRFVEGALKAFLSTIAASPEILVGGDRRDAFAAELIQAATLTAGPLIEDGLTPDEFGKILQAVLQTAGHNTHLIDMSGHIRPVVEIFGQTLSSVTLRDLRSPEERQALAIRFLRSLGNRQDAWKVVISQIGAGNSDIVRFVFQGVTEGLTSGGDFVFAPHFEAAVARSIDVALDHAADLVDKNLDQKIPALAVQAIIVTVRENSNTAFRPEVLPLLVEKAFARFLTEAIADPAKFTEADATAFTKLVITELTGA